MSTGMYSYSAVAYVQWDSLRARLHCFSYEELERVINFEPRFRWKPQRNPIEKDYEC